MPSPKKKFYVIWSGGKPGVYSTWAECEAVTKGVKGAKFKSFPSLAAARSAFAEGSGAHWGKGKAKKVWSKTRSAAVGTPVSGSLCVDAAWNSVTKVMEYRGVWLDDGSIAFEEGPFDAATNNIGEFLAVVEALQHLNEAGSKAGVYTDSRTAMAWVRKQQVRSESMVLGKTSKEIGRMVTKALKWLMSHEDHGPVLKWQTRAWGEVPADYGRK